MKRSWGIALLVLCFAVVFLWMRRTPVTSLESSPTPLPEHPSIGKTVPIVPPSVQNQGPIPSISAPPQRLGPRPFYGDLPQGVKSLRDLPMANHPTPQWKARLEGHLKLAGGEDLKTLEVTPQESYIIRDGNEGRYVERVVVTVTAKDGRFTRFFAEVDSQSGHVTKSWGATIHENNQPLSP